MNKLHVKKDDTVIVISGDDRGKKGKVLEVSPKEGKIIVMLYCDKCDRGVRVKKAVGEDGKKVRLCAKCGAKL